MNILVDLTHLSVHGGEPVSVGKSKENQGATEQVATQSETPDEALAQAYDEITAQLADEILEETMKLSSTAFEQMVLDLMTKMGYGTLEVSAHKTPATGGRRNRTASSCLTSLALTSFTFRHKHYAADHPVGRPGHSAVRRCNFRKRRKGSVCHDVEVYSSSRSICNSRALRG